MIFVLDALFLLNLDIVSGSHIVCDFDTVHFRLMISSESQTHEGMASFSNIECMSNVPLLVFKTVIECAIIILRVQILVVSLQVHNVVCSLLHMEDLHISTW